MSESPAVRNRHVFYVSGFDPKGPAWYHHTYSTEASKQAAISGYAITVGERQRVGKHVARWHVGFDEREGHVDTVYDFLRWDDVMRRYWPRGPFTMLWVMLRTYSRYLTTGVLWRVLKLTWATFLAAIYPAAFLIVVFVAALVAMALLAGISSLAGWSWWPGAILGLPLAWLIIHFGSLFIEQAYGAQWLIRIYAFNLLQARRQVPELEERLDGFARHVVDCAAKTNADEILVIGHSTGAQTAISLLDRVLKLDPQFAQRDARISFLTLGGSIPMMGWQPEADWLRAALKRIIAQSQIDWLDFTVAQDGATFALQDPSKLLSARPPEEEHDKPKLLSTKLFDLFSPEGFKNIRRNWRRVHFHYLMASERKADYDYFAMTAGPLILRDRFAHRATTRRFDRFQLRVFRRWST